MEDEIKCVECDKEFNHVDSLAMHNRAKHPEKVPKEKKPLPIKKIKNYTIAIIILGLIIYGIFFAISSSANTRSLPPTSMEGHIEANPPSHILKKPMGISIQKHMLEHVDGIDGGDLGIIINYDCKNYECDADLIDNLEAFTLQYSNVYVAPFKNMEVKIAITMLGRIETYNEFDAAKIETFITGIAPLLDELEDHNDNEKPHGDNEPHNQETTDKEDETNEEDTSSEDIPETTLEDVVREISIDAKRFEFNPRTITVKEGEKIKLTINNLDTTHGINIPDLGVSGFNSLEFTADKKGEFTFYCNNFCGSGHDAMQGKIIVE